jgi:PRTRC genetic system protein A
VRPVGYLLNKKEGLEGDPGLFFNYILAEDGLFIRTENPLVKTTLCISPVEIRGLSPLKESIELTHGKIPRHLYDLSVSILMAGSDREQYLAITWEDEYRLRVPPQERNGASVKYESLPSSIMDIHSHGHMDAFFSCTDDSDEKGLRLYMVVGRLDTLLPEVKLRLGAYGYFAPLSVEEVFDVPIKQRFF